MLILKGNNGKSRVIDILMNKTNSICFMYDDYMPISNAIGVDSKEYTLENFLEFVLGVLGEAVVNEKHYDYLLIYTNQSEEDLQEIINWLNEHRPNIPCRDIIITCK